MARRTNPARLAIAVGISSVLAIFLVYTAFGGSGIPAVQPSQLVSYKGDKVSLTGKVARPVRNDASGALWFRLRDIKGEGAVTVVYRGTIPDQFKVGRHVSLDGRLKNGVFVGEGAMVTKCPSKYTAKKS